MSRTPAILGGTPIRENGIPEWPINDAEVRAALDDVFQSGDWGRYHGKHVQQLVNWMAEFARREFVIPCSSGTAAVELALRGLRVQPGDEVIMSAYDFRGNIGSVLASGAVPVLIDVRPDDFQLNVDLVEAAITEKTKAILASHLHGGTVNLPELRRMADVHRLGIIEDACQNPGSTVASLPAGTWGDVGIWSFGGSKTVTAGRGGVLFTNDPQIHQRVRLHQFRHNEAYPLSELQAAVLLPQLKRLNERNNVRQQAAENVITTLSGFAFLKPFARTVPNSTPGTYKIGFRYDEQMAGLTRELWVTAMRAEGVAIDVGFESLHRCHSRRRFHQPAELKHADDAHDSIVCLHHPVLLGTEDDLRDISQAVSTIDEHASAIRQKYEAGELGAFSQQQLEL